MQKANDFKKSSFLSISGDSRSISNGQPLVRNVSSNSDGGGDVLSDVAVNDNKPVTNAGNILTP